MAEYRKCNFKKLLKQLLIKTETFAVNKHFEAQRRLTSKKEKKTCRLKIETKKKLKAFEKDKLLNVVIETKSSLCAQCYCEFDRNGNRELVKNISCTSLFHASCDLMVESSPLSSVKCSACRDWDCVYCNSLFLVIPKAIYLSMIIFTEFN